MKHQNNNHKVLYIKILNILSFPPQSYMRFEVIIELPRNIQHLIYPRSPPRKRNKKFNGVQMFAQTRSPICNHVRTQWSPKGPNLTITNPQEY